MLISVLQDYMTRKKADPVDILDYNVGTVLPSQTLHGHMTTRVTYWLIVLRDSTFSVSIQCAFRAKLQRQHRVSKHSHGVPRRMDVLARGIFFFPLLIDRRPFLSLHVGRCFLCSSSPGPGDYLTSPCHSFKPRIAMEMHRAKRRRCWRRTAESKRKDWSMKLIVEKKMDASSLLFRQNVRERTDEKSAVGSSGRSGEEWKVKSKELKGKNRNFYFGQELNHKSLIL